MKQAPVVVDVAPEISASGRAIEIALSDTYAMHRRAVVAEANLAACEAKLHAVTQELERCRASGSQ